MQSIRTKLAASLGIAAMLLLTSLGVAVYSLISVTDRSAAVLDGDLPRMQLFNEMYQEGLLGGQAIRNYILHPGPIPRKTLPASEAAFDAAMKNISAQSDAATRDALSKIINNWNMVKDARHKAETLADANNTQGALSVIEGDETPHWRDLRHAVMDLVNEESAKVRTDAHADLVQARQRIWIAVCTAGFAFILGGALVAITVGRFTERLFRLTGHVERATRDHDLTLRLESDSSDEAGRISASFNRFMESLQKTVQIIHEKAEAVASTASQISSTSARIADASHAQSDATARTAASVEEMTTSIASVAATAEEVSSGASHSLSQTEAGNEAVKSLISEMSRIEGVVDEIASQVDAFVSSTRAISQLTDKVKDIADQTNLLALNAAIEAARAGESGRGFAVVADEVRKLAEISSQSAREIDDVTSLLDKQSHEVESKIENGLDALRSSRANADLVTGVLHEARRASESTHQGVGGIASSVSEQRIVSTDIARNIERIARMAEENSLVVKDASASAIQLKTVAESLGEAAGRFRV
jgi:methyl-accepting chemotaxis protein